MKTKFYALMSGTKDVTVATEKTLFDKKSKKRVTKVEEKVVKQPTSVLVTLGTARNRIEARNTALDYAKKNGLSVKSINSFNNR